MFNTIRRSWTYYVAFLAFWSTVILFDAARDVVAIEVGAVAERSFHGLVQEWLKFWGTWVLVSSPLPWLVARFSTDGSGTRRWIIVHVAGSFLATVSHLFLAAVAFWSTSHGASLSSWFFDFLLDLSFRDLALYWALLGCLMAWHHHLRSRDRELEAARLAARAGRLEAAAQSARLDALSRQLQPHFLFNALHAVGALIRRKDRTRALEALERIGELLRLGFDPGAPAVTPLREEIHRVEQYLGLQQVRFGDRLRVTWRVEDAALSRAVPCLILQPIVENAVKHGIERSTDPVRIVIGGHVDGAHTCLSVTDDGPGMDASAPLGIGLSNTLDRLSLLYGDGADLRIRERGEGGTEVLLRLPDQPAHAAGASVAKEFLWMDENGRPPETGTEGSVLHA